MESIQESVVELSSFFRSISSWPGTEPELANLAARIAKICQVPFVAVGSLASAPGLESMAGSMGAPPGAEKVGFHYIPQSESERLGDPVIKDFLKKAVKLNPERYRPGELQKLQLTREMAPVFHISALKNLELGVICGDLWAGPSIRGNRINRTFGWIVVGSAKPLEARQEVMLLAAAQRLSELAEVSQLEGVIAMRSQFLSIASHELKTPLTSIYGILQLQERMLRLKKDEPESVQLERQQSFLKMVIRQVERLNELIDGLLDVSRIQNGRFMVEPSETDVAAVVRESTSTRLNVIAQEAGVKLQVELPDSLNAWVDPVRLEEVITNLVMNAIRFSPEGGTVWIKLRTDGDGFQLSVRDQGPAVPIEDRERIFQPFERAQRTARLGGLGLGLFISRQIAQLHGGNVSLIESLPGKGNVFAAYFPTRESASISA